jgi:hypothetical protein
MYYNLTKIFKDINSGKFANKKPKTKKRLGNFKATWGKRIKKMEEIENKKLMYSVGRGSNAKTLCTREILNYVALYMNSKKDLMNIEIEHELIFNRGLIEKYFVEK